MYDHTDTCWGNVGDLKKRFTSLSYIFISVYAHYKKNNQGLDSERDFGQTCRGNRPL